MGVRSERRCASGAEPLLARRRLGGSRFGGLLAGGSLAAGGLLAGGLGLASRRSDCGLPPSGTAIAFDRRRGIGCGGGFSSILWPAMVATVKSRLRMVGFTPSGILVAEMWTERPISRPSRLNLEEIRDRIGRRGHLDLMAHDVEHAAAL